MVFSQEFKLLKELDWLTNISDDLVPLFNRLKSTEISYDGSTTLQDWPFGYSDGSQPVFSESTPYFENGSHYIKFYSDLRYCSDSKVGLEGAMLYVKNELSDFEKAEAKQAIKEFLENRINQFILHNQKVIC